MEIASTKLKSYRVTIKLDEAETKILSKAYDILHDVEGAITKYQNDISDFSSVTIGDLENGLDCLRALIIRDRIIITIINSD